MNLKKSFSLAVVVGVSAAALLTACEGKQSNTTTAPGTSAAAAVTPQVSPIVYVNADSLQANYKYFADIKKALETKNKGRQSQLETRGNAFKKEMANAEKAAQTMTQEQQQQLGVTLQKKQQDIAMLQQNLTEEAMKEEQAETDKLYDKIAEYLKKYAADKGYKLVISYSKGASAILYADAQLDVTADVVKGLNADYKPETTK